MSGKSKRGFASMSPEQRREIAAKGGKNAHAAGKAHRFTSEEARIAGRAGGRSHSREHMGKIGKKGGEARWKNTHADLSGLAIAHEARIPKKST